jgi:hypothetical protein
MKTKNAFFSVTIIILGTVIITQHLRISAMRKCLDDHQLFEADCASHYTNLANFRFYPRKESGTLMDFREKANQLIEQDEATH